MFRIVAPSCCAASLLFLSAGCDSAPQAVTASTVPDDVPAIQVPAATADWPGWRGPQGNGVADANQSPPLHWSKTENVLWKATIPGKGHSSPTVVNDQVFLTTARENEPHVDLVRAASADRLELAILNRPQQFHLQPR